MTVRHLSRDELEAGLPRILGSPSESGLVALIVQRPAVGERLALDSGTLSTAEGLAGDNWKARARGKMLETSAYLDTQLTIMNARAVDLMAQDRSRWPLAGDQLYVDLDLSDDNLPAGSRLAVGEAVIEVTAIPHLGCRKFVQRFGRDAMEFVNSEQGRRLNLRGVNARVIEGGRVGVGDPVSVLSRANGSQAAESESQQRRSES